MKTVMQIVRKTSLFFQPQIRTKIMNEGWASYWHETLFLRDDRIARPRGGLRPGQRRGHRHAAGGAEPLRPGHAPVLLHRGGGRQGALQPASSCACWTPTSAARYDHGTGSGRDYIFAVRENLNDFLFINTFVEQDFVDRHRLFVAGKRLERAAHGLAILRQEPQGRGLPADGRWTPSTIRRTSTIDRHKTGEDGLYLVHHFEGKPLVQDFIANTLLGIEYPLGRAGACWRPARCKSIEQPRPAARHPAGHAAVAGPTATPRPEIRWQRVRYTMKDREADAQGALQAGSMEHGPQRHAEHRAGLGNLDQRVSDRHQTPSSPSRQFLRAA